MAFRKRLDNLINKEETYETSCYDFIIYYVDGV